MIEARGVTKTFANLAVLRRISLSFSAGEVVILAGANGAGKSTLLRVLAGLARPDSGEVVRDATRIGFLSHHLFLYGRLSVRENLELFASAQGIKDAQTIIDEMELSNVASRPLCELSKGMQARVGLARAFLGGPDLIMLDEPTSNLDEKGTALLTAAIKRVQRDTQGRATIIIATHDLHRLAHIATRAVVLEAGVVGRDSGSSASSETVEQVLAHYREVNR